MTQAARLYLVDAHAYLHRAYHALPPLKNSKGEPVGALFGFARMLLSLEKRVKPEFIAVCFDAPGPTFRHKAFKDYKGTRKEIDEDLKVQLGMAREMVESMGLRCFEASGYEADDLMATLARKGEKEGLSVVLVTGDKDALQLVGGKITVWNEAKGEMLDSAKVAEKFKVQPALVADYLALIGDSTDNVPGVPGVGPVGAVKLLSRFGNLEGVIKAAAKGDPDIPAKTQTAIREGEEQLRLSRKLVELDEAVPLKAKLEECSTVTFDPARAATVFKRFEFSSLVREVAPPGAPAEDAAAPAAETAVRVENLPEPMALKAWLKAAASAEHVALAWRSAGAGASSGELPLGESKWILAMSLLDGRAAVVASDELGANRAALSNLLADPETVKIGHDLKELMKALAESSLPVKTPRFDTMLAAYCLNPTRPRFDFDSVYPELVRTVEPIEEEPRAACLREAIRVWKLAEVAKPKLKKDGVLKLYEDLELPLLDVLADMEVEGIGLDRDYLERLRVEFAQGIESIEKELSKLAGGELNLNSTKQLRKLLFDDLKLPVIHKTPKGEPSTDEETLVALSQQHPLPAKIIDFRELSKLKSTYIDGLLAKITRAGRVHTHFDQTGAATGRLSSLDPNLQNIPIRTPLGQKIRRAFVPRPGAVFVSADYSQIDLRVLAHISEDEALCEAFRSGEDVHTKTACEIFEVKPDKVDKEMRRRAKAVNFGIVYGQTAHGLSQGLGIPYGAAREYIEKYFARYSGVKKWIERNLDQARADGFVRTILGRVRYLPDLAAKNTAVRQFNERAAANTPIQGSSADIIKQAMVNIHRKMLERAKPWRSKTLLQVHDELLFECPKAEAEEFGRWARKEMETAVKLKVPLIVDLKVGENWQDMKPVNS